MKEILLPQPFLSPRITDMSSFILGYVCSPLQLPKNRATLNLGHPSSPLHLFQVHIICQFHVLGMNLKNFQAACSIRDSNIYLSVNATCGTIQGCKTEVTDSTTLLFRVNINASQLTKPLGKPR